MELPWGMCAPHLHCCFSKAWQTAARQTLCYWVLADPCQSGLLLGLTDSLYSLSFTYFRCNWYWWFCFQPYTFSLLKCILIWGAGSVCAHIFGLKFLCVFVSLTSHRAPVTQRLQPVLWHYRGHAVGNARLARSFSFAVYLRIISHISLLIGISNKQIKPLTFCVPKGIHPGQPFQTAGVQISHCINWK